MKILLRFISDSAEIQADAGTPYQTLSKIIHIGIHDFSMFKDEKEFYATYQFANIKNFRIYSDKIIFSVLNLTQIANATEEDKAYKLDLWVSAFKAATWEELLMLAKKELLTLTGDTQCHLIQTKYLQI